MAMDSFLRAGMQGRILEVNETYCRMTGYSEHELLTMAIADVEAVQSVEMIAAKMRRLAELRAVYGEKRCASVAPSSPITAPRPIPTKRLPPGGCGSCAPHEHPGVRG